ncbi:nuclear transport factor 2 family protein [Flavobacterium sp.]|uniref:nuclear transport factor 2 family protein n=1 Tax=Flavobacterium sp. TaxID=239 RepID=UPI002633DD4A|nr:nuclear transport factor 2 family protein [Flavobacterium sp.]
MQPKDLVLDLYKSDVLLHRDAVKQFLHPELIIEWNSTKGFVQMDAEDVLNLSEELNRAYVRSKIRISHIIQEGNFVSVRYSHFVKTIENPREEMLLANFFVIWEVKDQKLYRGYQMSQFG